MRDVERSVRVVPEAHDTCRRIASKISVPDGYRADAREESRMVAREGSREQAPFGDRWNGRYEPSDSRRAGHDRSSHRDRSHQQHKNKADSQSSDYSSSSAASGTSASSGQS